jgi:hypothetical protein
MVIRVIHRVGRRGAYLLFLALLDFIYAYALFVPTPRAMATPTYTFLAQMFPLEPHFVLMLWGMAWAAVGFVCLVTAFSAQDAIGYAVAIFLKILWASIFLLGWLFADVERGYLSTAIWGAFAAVTGLISTWPDDAKRYE